MAEPAETIGSRPRLVTLEEIKRDTEVEAFIIKANEYTGAIGYWDVSGDCDWNIAIRTIVAGGGVASLIAAWNVTIRPPRRRSAWRGSFSRSCRSAPC